MPINGPRPRPGGPGEVNLGMYHDPPRRGESVGYGGGSGETPNFEQFWNVTGRKMFGTPPIKMARGGSVSQEAIDAHLESQHYADMPLGGPVAGTGQMASVMPGDHRTPWMKKGKYADMPLGGPMKRGGPVKTGYARGGPVRYDQYGVPIREEDDVNPSTAPEWSPEQRKMAMYELGEAQGYAEGGTVEDDFAVEEERRRLEEEAAIAAEQQRQAEENARVAERRPEPPMDITPQGGRTGYVEPITDSVQQAASRNSFASRCDELFVEERRYRAGASR